MTLSPHAVEALVRFALVHCRGWLLFLRLLMQLLLAGSRRLYARGRQRVVAGGSTGARRQGAVRATWQARVRRLGAHAAARVGGAWRAVAACCAVHLIRLIHLVSRAGRAARRTAAVCA